MRNRFSALLTALPLLLCACTTAAPPESSTAETTAPPPPSEYTLVTLGDSISYGYGLENPAEQRYSALLTEKLSKKDGVTWNDCNYAVSGDDSTDLIKRLNDGKALRLPSADVIVVCIGANNLLGVYTALLSDMTGDFDPSDFTGENQEEIMAQVQEKLADREQLAESMQAKIDENLVRLENDLETIYNWIRERNSTAEIYFLDIYNPYRGMQFPDYYDYPPQETTPAETEEPAPDTADEPLYRLIPNGTDFGVYSQLQIDRANTIICDFVLAHGDDESLHTVDIAGAFALEEEVPVIGSGEDARFPDPHPTAYGQQIIADTVLTAMRGSAVILPDHKMQETTT